MKMFTVSRKQNKTNLFLTEAWGVNGVLVFRGSVTRLAVRRGFSARAGGRLPLHLRSRLRNPNSHKVYDVVQVGEKIGSWEPAVMTVLLNAGLLEAEESVRQEDVLLEVSSKIREL